jgi:hypothetical protein
MSSSSSVVYLATSFGTQMLGSHCKSLRTMTMSSLVIVSTSVWVPQIAFGLHAHVPLVSLTTRLGFHMQTLLPWQALG